MALPEFLENLSPNRYLENDYVVADLETTNKDKGSALTRTNRIVLATWVEGSRGRDVPRSDDLRYHWGAEFDQEELSNAVSRAGFLVAHNGKFELQWLQRCGVEIGRTPLWDTMLAEFVLAGNRRWPLDLDSVARRHGLSEGKESLVSKLIKGGVCPSEIPEQWLLEYCSRDTLLCLAVFLKQRELLAEKGLLPVVYTRCLLTPVLADIEMQGVQLDAKRVKEEYELTSREFTAKCHTLARVGGEINWSSPQQVAEFIYDRLGFSELRRGQELRRTPTGQRLTDADALSLLRANTKEQREFLELFKEYKKLEKRLQTLEKLKKCVAEADGRLYAQLNQAIAGTHRLTSSGHKYKIQYQNVDHTLKKLFRARRPGWRIGEADGVQLEFRVAAHLGRDPVALADIRDPNFDAHWQTAEERKGKSRIYLTKEDRRDAKPFTFRPLYGATSGNSQERAYIKFFQGKYRKIYETQTEWTNRVLRDKELRTETGLIFYWPDTKLEPSRDGRGYIRNRTAIFNYPVQSLATADIIPIAIVYLYYRLKDQGLDTFLVNTVHDSVIAEVAPGDEDAFRRLCERCFTVDCFHYLNRVYGIDFVSPLGCETKVGDFWGDGKEEKYDYDPVKKAT